MAACGLDIRIDTDLSATGLADDELGRVNPTEPVAAGVDVAYYSYRCL